MPRFSKKYKSFYDWLDNQDKIFQKTRKRSDNFYRVRTGWLKDKSKTLEELTGKYVLKDCTLVLGLATEKSSVFKSSSLEIWVENLRLYSVDGFEGFWDELTVYIENELRKDVKWEGLFHMSRVHLHGVEVGDIWGLEIEKSAKKGAEKKRNLLAHVTLYRTGYEGIDNLEEYRKLQERDLEVKKEWVSKNV